MTKRKPLTWYDTDLGPVPDCTACAQRLMDPTFISAVYSVSIERPESPDVLARAAINQHHERRHVDG